MPFFKQHYLSCESSIGMTNTLALNQNLENYNVTRMLHGHSIHFSLSARGLLAIYMLKKLFSLVYYYYCCYVTFINIFQRHSVLICIFARWTLKNQALYTFYRTILLQFIHLTLKINNQEICWGLGIERNIKCWPCPCRDYNLVKNDINVKKYRSLGYKKKFQEANLKSYQGNLSIYNFMFICMDMLFGFFFQVKYWDIYFIYMVFYSGKCKISLFLIDSCIYKLSRISNYFDHKPWKFQGILVMDLTII